MGCELAHQRACSTRTHRAWRSPGRHHGRPAVPGSWYSRARLLQRQMASGGDAASAMSEAERERLRNALCIGVEAGEGPTRCEFDDRQERRVAAARNAARRLASKAARALDSGDRYVRDMARRMFAIESLDVPAMVSTISAIRGALDTKPVVCGTCSDEVCNDAPAAYVPDDLGSIVICPFFFSLSIGQWIRTMLHEGGHAVGIDAMPDYVHPPNCVETDAVLCDDPCAGVPDRLHNVDVWARFIECAGYSW